MDQIALNIERSLDARAFKKELLHDINIKVALCFNQSPYDESCFEGVFTKCRHELERTSTELIEFLLEKPQGIRREGKRLQSI